MPKLPGFQAIVAIVATACLALPATAATVYNNGLVNNLTSAEPSGVQVSATTTLNVLGGGVVTQPPSTSSGFAAAAAQLNQGSTVRVDGGFLQGGEQAVSGFAGQGIRVADSTVEVMSGTVVGGTNSSSGFSGVAIDATNSTVTITGGTVRAGDNTGSGFAFNAIRLFNSSDLQMSGGTVTHANAGNSLATIQVGNSSTATFTGGTVSHSGFGSQGALQVLDTGMADIFGGIFTGGIRVNSGGTLNIYGQDFNFNGNVLTGLLDNGDVFNTFVTVQAGGALNLITAAIPLPASVLMLLGALAGLGTFGRSRARVA